MERKIVILDGYACNPGDLSWERLRKAGDLTVYERTCQEDVVGRAEDAEIILTNKVGFDDALMSRLPRLRYIGVLATGYNIIDVEAASRRGIVVTNIPAYSTEGVAQMTFAHILNITNRIGHYADECRKGRWSSAPDFCYWDTPLIELSGKTLGIVGLGNIGSRVATIARSLGMDVYAYTSKNSADLKEGIQKATMEGLYGVSDILSLHCPLNEMTRELINRESLSKMKRGAILINTGRGQLVNEHDVAEALATGQLGAYGADVMCDEPPSPDNPLLQCENAFLTPHIAWASPSSRERLVNVAVDNVMAYVEGRVQNNVSIRKDEPQENLN